MRRSWQRRLLVLVLLVFILPTANLVWNRYDTRSLNERKLAEAVSALDQSDPGWRMDDLLAKRDAACPPDDRNLTKLCWDIHEARPKGFEQRTALGSDWHPAGEFNRLPMDERLAAARKEFAEAEAAVRLARTVRTRPTGGWKLVVPANPFDTLLEHTQRVRTVAVLLDADAVLAAIDDDQPRAVRAVENTLHLCHAVGDEPFLISQLVRMALSAIAAHGAQRVAGWGEPPAASLAWLQSAFLMEADFPRLAVAFRGERAFVNHLFVHLDAGRFTMAQLSGQPAEFGDGFGYWVYKGHLPGDHACSLEFQTKLLEIAHDPTHIQIDRYADLALPPKEPQTALSRLILPAFDKVTAADWRTRARLRSAAAGLACERFRQANNRWPNDLAELKELLPTIPPDPYDGEPLRYRKVADGMVVYAVGPDRQDDGGTLSYGNPQPGEDVGFRLWDVAARRQPAAGNDGLSDGVSRLRADLASSQASGRREPADGSHRQKFCACR